MLLRSHLKLRLRYGYHPYISFVHVHHIRVASKMLLCLGKGQRKLDNNYLKSYTPPCKTKKGHEEVGASLLYFKTRIENRERKEQTILRRQKCRARGSNKKGRTSLYGCILVTRFSRDLVNASINCKEGNS